MDITGIGSIADLARDVIARIWPKGMDEKEKINAELALRQVLEAREQQLVAAQKEIIVAEMHQSDVFTRRARPMIVYAGLLFIFVVHVIFPVLKDLLGGSPPEIALPEEFWWAWTGAVGIWVIGRSAEKMGYKARGVTLATGTRP